MKKFVAIVLFSILICCACVALVACNPDLEVPPPQYVFGYTSVEGGEIQGVVNQEQSVAVFKGIPYAKAPVGDLRWRAPQPVESWEGTLDCTLWGANALQGDATVFDVWTEEFIQDTDPTHYRDGIVYSEDCLNLNVWSSTTTWEQKPVLVYIHGGGYNSGGASCEVYDGTNIALKDVVFVSIHYRVGALGFLATQELADEDPNGSAGNYGILDQIQALKWVQDNIEQFGGDKNNVTIMGQSAGAGSVNALLCSPLAKGLFVNAVSASHNSINRDWQTLEQRIAQAPSNYKGRPVDQLRAIPASQLKGQSLPTVGPVIDGHVLSDTYRNCVASGNCNEVNLMTGMVTHDDLISSVYTSSTITAVDSMIALQNAVCQARINGGLQKDAYVYMFTRNVPGNTKATTGAYHSYELAYFLGNFTEHRASVWTEQDFELGEAMLNYLVAFCKTGSPSYEEEPVFWANNIGDLCYLQFDVEIENKTLDENIYQKVMNNYKLGL